MATYKRAVLSVPDLRPAKSDKTLCQVKMSHELRDRVRIAAFRANLSTSEWIRRVVWIRLEEDGVKADG